MPKQVRSWIVMILAVFLCAASPAMSEEKAENTPGAEAGEKEIVALVNGTEITRSELDRQLGNMRQRFTGQRTGETDLELEQKVLDNLIQRELIYQAAQNSQVAVSDDQVQKSFEQAKGRFPDEETFQEVLARENITPEDIKAEIRQALTINTYIQENFVDKVSVDEEQIKTYYEQNQEKFAQPEKVKASHILIKVAPDADEQTKAEARKKIEDVQKKVEAGEDFAELAKTHSEGPSNVRGGDLGFFGRGQMVKPFEDAAFALEVDQVSPVVETQFGYHLIKLHEKKAPETPSLEDMKDRIEQFLKREKVQELVGEKIEELKKNGKIENFLASKTEEKTE